MGMEPLKLGKLLIINQLKFNLLICMISIWIITDLSQAWWSTICSGCGSGLQPCSPVLHGFLGLPFHLGQLLPSVPSPMGFFSPKVLMHWPHQCQVLSLASTACLECLGRTRFHCSSFDNPKMVPSMLRTPLVSRISLAEGSKCSAITRGFCHC